MKTLLIIVTAFLSASAIADTTVRGYVRSDGTYVAPHVRSSPNSNRYDNYSSQGNANPYTGQQGSQRNELSDMPTYNKNYGNPNYGNQYKNPYNNRGR
jgi:hypothetical protein